MDGLVLLSTPAAESLAVDSIPSVIDLISATVPLARVRSMIALVTN